MDFFGPGTIWASGYPTAFAILIFWWIAYKLHKK